ncbi:MAG: 5-(carboxyamino)imidazole ribonucleotide mutase [Planctomycetes bacterium]|nr:5-(carboxyamino)imidazole ribonucleotide mutase [Planctomycetota bacterium]
MSSPPLVAVVLGSANDIETIEPCLEQLRALAVPYEVRVLSAHRTPDAAAAFARGAADAGLRVLIGAAGMAAHLAGTLAASTPLPVIGVPLPSPLGGAEALLSTVQMPGGVPVACVAVGKAGPVNAAILAAQILGVGDPAFRERIRALKEELARDGLARDREMREKHRWAP